MTKRKVEEEKEGGGRCPRKVEEGVLEIDKGGRGKVREGANACMHACMHPNDCAGGGE